MRRHLVLPFLLLASMAFAQTGLWEKKGVLGGSIQDIIKDTNLVPSQYIIGTDAGFYGSPDTVNWTPARSGFHDFSIVQMAWAPVDATTSVYVALTYDGVYARSSPWPDWRYATDTGLQNSGGTIAYGYQAANAVAFYKEGSTLYVYLTLHGLGIYKRSFDPSNSISPWGPQWIQDTTYSFNMYFSALIQVDGSNRLVAATIGDGGSNAGNLFMKSGSTWSATGMAGVNYTALAGDPMAGGSAVVLAGTKGDGVFISTDLGANFGRLCGQISTLGEWKDLSLAKVPSGQTYGTGTTGGTLYKLNPNDCANPYTAYSYFTGYSESVFTVSDNAALAGTQGTGLWYYPSPTQPGEPRGVTGSNAIQNKNVGDIEITFSSSRPDAPPVLFTASESDGLYKCFKPDYCVRYFFAPIPGRTGGVRGRSIALVPGYDEFGEVKYNAGNNYTIIGKKTLYLGTADYGVFRSDNGGASWRRLIAYPVDTITGKSPEIAQLVLSPDFDPATTGTFDKHMFILTRDARIFFSPDGGETWSTSVDLNLANQDLLGEDLAISPAYNRSDPSTQVLFAATSAGVFKRVWINGSPGHFEWQRNMGVNQAVHAVALSPCFGFAACPECPGGDVECPKEKSTVLLGTNADGIYFSFDSGVSFSPMPVGTCPGTGTSVTALTMHPRTDIPNTASRLLAYAVKHTFSILDNQDNPEMFYLYWQTAGPSKWVCATADPSSPSLPDFSNYMIRRVTFSPNFSTGASGNHDVYAGHDYAGMWHAFHPPAGSIAWQKLDGFYNTPGKINGLAECPDPISTGNPHKAVLAGTEDYGVMISFDSGESFYPWGYGLEYVAGASRLTLHNAAAVACTELFDPCGPPTPCGRHRILASASDCTAFDMNANCTARIHQGIYWADWFTPDQQSRWITSTLDGLGMAGHLVPELRYCAPSLPVLAADAGIGALFSNSGGIDGWGQNWHIDSAGDPPLDITDLTCPGGQPGPMFGLRSIQEPRGGRGGFVWGAQSGVTQGIRIAAGAAKFKTSSTGSWQTCAGLSTSANWRSAIMLDTGTALIGDQGENSNLSSGIYRNDQDGSTCSAWTPANTGFNPGDSEEIAVNYSKKVIAFAKVANGVLAALEQGGLSNREGGVFFSDTVSDGLAWVPVNSGMTCTSNAEVYSGSSIYTGSTCNGVYAADTITYTGYPTALFTAVKLLDPWHENRVAFTNRSAGLVTSCSWNFGDTTGSTTCNPTHDYDVQNYLNATVTLTGTNAASKSDSFSASVEVVDTKITSVAKVSGNILHVAWDVPGGGKSYTYTLWADTAPGGTGAAAVAGCEGLTVNYCEFSESGAEVYYKVKTQW